MRSQPPQPQRNTAPRPSPREPHPSWLSARKPGKPVSLSEFWDRVDP